MNEIKSIVIIGRLWFDKINGNSYYSAVGLVEGEVKAQIEFSYGYGDQYVWDTWTELVKVLNLTDVEKYQYGNIESLWQYCQRKGINYYTTASMSKERRILNE